MLASMLTFSLGGAWSLLAQDPNPSPPAPSGGWRRFDPSNPPDVTPAPPPPPAQAPSQAPRYNPPAQAPAPSAITVPAGTWITVRTNEPLSSDHNQQGDYFRATLVQPVVINGLVIAPRGQSVTGEVTEAKKAGRVEGTSRLRLELTEIGLTDGRQVQVRTTLMERRGGTSHGRDAAAIGATTATGAAIGAAVNGGVGAGVGAAAGVVASTIGVLLTRGHPTVVYPESVLSFRLAQPVTLGNTDAFYPVSQRDYAQAAPPQRPQGPGYGAPPPYYGPPAYYPPPPYSYYGAFGPYSGFFWGPSFNFFYGRGFRRW